jgi:hypothetical protein
MPDPVSARTAASNAALGLAVELHTAVRYTVITACGVLRARVLGVAVVGRTR